jgi:glyoxylase-like metal-dependent hydrolase (beta-lactamase superfamily II)
MRVHHLNGLTMCPWLGKSLVNHRGHMVCHCLLIESRNGLIVVDTALGSDDLADPARRLGRGFMLVGPQLLPDRTIAAQVMQRGFRVEDVRHVVLTHLDVDHAGGIGDFPQAEVHASGTEIDAALSPRTLIERERYRSAQWAHGPRWVRHPDAGERWNGFEAVRCIADDPDLLLVPLFGHTRGHCGVAVRTAEGWLLHAGDAYFHQREMGDPPRCSPGLAAFQRLVATDNAARLHNQGRLRDLARGGLVKVFCAHDPDELSAQVGVPGRETAAQV